MYSLIVLEDAKQEWFAAIDYYETKQKGLGERFLKAVEEYLKVLSETPKLYKKTKKQYREVPIKHFPFLIIYRINELNNEVVVVSVFHAKRHPKHKYNKG